MTPEQAGPRGGIMAGMTPERRAAIIEAIHEDEKSYLAGMYGSDVWSEDGFTFTEPTEAEIAAFDKWLQDFPR